MYMESNDHVDEQMCFIYISVFTDIFLFIALQTFFRKSLSVKLYNHK